MSAFAVLAGVAIAAATLGAAARAGGGPGTWAVAGALLRRRALNVISYRARLILGVANALLFAVLLAFVGRSLLPALGLGPAAKDTITFVALGIALWPAAWVGYQSSANAVRREQLLGTLEILAATPAGIEAMPFAALVVDGLIALAGAAVFFALVPLLIGTPLLVAYLPLAGAAVALAGSFLWGIGLVFGGLTLVYKDVGPAVAILRIGLIVLSGAFVPLTFLPAWVAPWARFLPLTMAFDLARGGLAGTVDDAWALLSLALLAGASLVSIAIGTRAFSHGLVVARRVGVLHGY